MERLDADRVHIVRTSSLSPCCLRPVHTILLCVYAVRKTRARDVPDRLFLAIDLMTLTSPHYHRYHYFAAKETYNIIRNLIAGYVFLTGFGNYSFFYIKGDFGFKRVIKMLFRLNFLVAMIAITLNKRYAPGALSRRLPIHVISPHLYRSYMLYYICALHTWWFLVVYGTMAIYGSYNQNNTVAAIKFGLLFLFITFLYDVRPDTPHTHTHARTHNVRMSLCYHARIASSAATARYCMHNLPQ